MAVTVRQLAELVQGKVVGDGSLLIHAARTLHEAQPGEITFLDQTKNAAKLAGSHASAAVVPRQTVSVAKVLIEVEDPLFAFIAIVKHFQGAAPFKPSGIDPRAALDPSVIVGAEPSIAPFVTVGAGSRLGNRCRLEAGASIGRNCLLGDDVFIHSNAVLYDDTVLGDRVTIHANATLGADGFGYRLQQGRHVKVPQLGNVVVGNDVEIGAGATIDRGTFGPTRIGDGTKIDNLVQIAHNCAIGKHNAIAAQVGIAGSCTTGDYVFMGGQAGVRDHLHIGDRAMLAAKSGIANDVPAGRRMFLSPAHDERDAARISICIGKLPEMRRDLLRILKELDLMDEAGKDAPRKPQAPAA
ncbi:MAG: UDP-3-O-(3-hydroxymyristoyl)glucosamine N-acyltransferase [Planctomycetes bacterium]|nr:UDP-3-O-(3-hydroxymyristoyl)glucosamine N-acyltransferase [Planctomycetota bacterium]